MLKLEVVQPARLEFYMQTLMTEMCSIQGLNRDGVQYKWADIRIRISTINMTALLKFTLLASSISCQPRSDADQTNVECRPLSFDLFFKISVAIILQRDQYVWIQIQREAVVAQQQ